MAVLAAIYWSRNAYVPYIPVVRGNDADHTLSPDASLLTQDHVDAISKLLSRYGESYKVIDGKLHIRRSLANNRDLLANYTTKALDGTD